MLAIAFGFVIGFAQGYLLMPALYAVGALSRLLLRESERSGFIADTITVGCVGLAVFLLYLALCLTGRSLVEDQAVFGKAFAVGGMSGFAVYALLPVRPSRS